MKTCIGFNVAMATAVHDATERAHFVFLLDDDKDTYSVSPTYAPGWLFKAYPGGRKELSVAGTRRYRQTLL